MDEPRIKEQTSLRRKAADKGWTLQEAYSRASDLVGLRIVCNNLQDAGRAADLIERSLREASFEVRRQDWTSIPSSDGYRAIHLDVRVPMQLGPASLNVGCEVQIRSLLQDSWARLSRSDLYHPGGSIPPDLLRRMRGLSDLLARADRAADRVRQEIARPRRGRAPIHGRPVTAAVLAFVYRRVFGEDPEDYVVQSALRECAGTKVRADGIEATLRDKAYRQKLTEQYTRSARWDPEPSQLFRWVSRAAAYGPSAGLSAARAAGRADWKEIEAFGRREMISELPSDWRAFVSELGLSAKDADPSSVIETWAECLGATRRCFCGTTIVDPSGMAAELVSHYELTDEEADAAQEEIESAILSSGVELGDSGVCSYHADVLSRDD